MSPFEAAAIVIVLAAALGYANERVLRLPQTSGLTVMSAVASAALVLIDRLWPGPGADRSLQAFLARIDFHKVLMDGMLSFLLFAGALHVDLGQLRRAWAPILALATLGVVASTVLVGGGLWLITRGMGAELAWPWCLVFGALISPTDPVAVLDLLHRRPVAPALQATVGGESLFNDGVGVVVFTILLAAAVGEQVSLGGAAKMFVLQAGGGVALGLALGWLAFNMMRSIDQYSVEVLITLAVVMGGYALAERVGVSGPVAMVVAGLIVGNQAVARAMTDTTRDYLGKFWMVIDQILNAALFVLIGLEAAALAHSAWALSVAALAIPLVLAVRTALVGVFLLPWRKFLPWRTSVALLSWGGLRGGISVALALALPASPAKSLLLVATYLVVLFSVVVQGPTTGPLMKWAGQREDDEPRSAAP